MTSSDLKSICVYCGSRFGRDPHFAEIARTVGKTIAEQGLRLVFGGGAQGLMGEAASSARDAGGVVLGIIPTFLQEQEGLLENIDSREVTTMHERKIGLFEESDAFCVLPGGIGTLEEMVEVMSWASLAIHKKPIVLVNVNNYWSPFIQLIEHICEGGFAYPGLRQSLNVIEDPAQIVDATRKALSASLQNI